MCFNVPCECLLANMSKCEIYFEKNTFFSSELSKTREINSGNSTLSPKSFEVSIDHSLLVLLQLYPYQNFMEIINNIITKL